MPRIGSASLAWGAGLQPLVQPRRAPSHLQAAGKLAPLAQAALDAVAHGGPDPRNALADLAVAAHGAFVPALQLGDGRAGAGRH
jgi:hypothetical protein